MVNARRLVLLCCGVLMLAGCGTAHHAASACSRAESARRSAGRAISTTNARRDMRCAGFAVSTRRFVFDDNLAPPMYIVGTRGYSGDDDWSPAVVFRFKNDALATDAAAHYSRAGLREMARYWRRYPGTAKGGNRSCGPGCAVGGMPRPRGFAVRKGVGYRICNVVLWSYNAHDDPRLTVKVGHATRLLRASCSDRG